MQLRVLNQIDLSDLTGHMRMNPNVKKSERKLNQNTKNEDDRKNCKKRKVFNKIL